MSSAADHSDPPRLPTLAERVRAPAGLKFRLLRARRTLKFGARVAAALAVLIVLATLFSYRANTAEQDRALAAAAEPAPTPTAAPPPPEPSPVVQAAPEPAVSPPASATPRSPKASTHSAPARRTPQRSKKSIRDFGF